MMRNDLWSEPESFFDKVISMFIQWRIGDIRLCRVLRNLSNKKSDANQFSFFFIVDILLYYILLYSKICKVENIKN